MLPHCKARLRITQETWNWTNLKESGLPLSCFPYRPMASLIFSFILDSSRSAVVSRLVRSVASSRQVPIPTLTQKLDLDFLVEQIDTDHYLQLIGSSFLK
jgi:hypothetical protein